MSRRRRGKSGSGARGRGKGDYRVGKYRPPPESRWKPGQSGNPKGRPKGRKSNATMLREILDRKLKVSVEGRMRSITVRELMLTRFADAGLKGDLKSGFYLLERDDAAEKSDVAHEPEETMEDRQIIESFLKSHLNRNTEDAQDS
jgi:hypothetical protein